MNHFINMLPKESAFDRTNTSQMLYRKAVEVRAEMNAQGLQPGDCFPTAGLLFALAGFLLHDSALHTIRTRMQIPGPDEVTIAPEDELSFFFAGLAVHHRKCGDVLAAEVLGRIAFLLKSDTTSVQMVEWLQRFVGVFELQLVSKWN